MASNIHKLSVTYSELPIVAKRKVTYSSGECDVVNMEGILETLAVFYDEIWLPYPYGFDPEGPVLWSISIPQSHYTQYRDTVFMMHEEYEKWHNKWKPLFDQGILKTLPPPITDLKEIPYGFAEVIRSKIGYQEDVSLSLFPLLSGELALAIHALYSPKPGPELFITNPVDTTTSRLAGFLVRSLFQLQIPQLQALTAEQVLEVRDYLQDTKEGFKDYIYTMVDDVEKRLKNGDKFELEAAQKIAERKILTSYDEFCRQLKAKKTGFWSKVLVSGGKFLQIDAAPWVPKFWGGLIGALFGSVDEAEKRAEEAQKNKSQAFQYLFTLESKVIKAIQDDKQSQREKRT